MSGMIKERLASRKPLNHAIWLILLHEKHSFQLIATNVIKTIFIAGHIVPFWWQPCEPLFMVWSPILPRTAISNSKHNLNCCISPAAELTVLVRGSAWVLYITYKNRRFIREASSKLASIWPLTYQGHVCWRWNFASFWNRNKSKRHTR